MSVKLLKELSELNGVPGNEKQIKDFMKKELADYSDKISYDNIGSIICQKGTIGPRIMVAAHMDEIGFMVSKITKEGYLKVLPLGGWWSQVVLAQQVVITTDDLKEYRGVTGSKPPHVLTAEERKKIVELSDVFIDIGVKDKEAVEKLGIKIGDMVTPYIEFLELADKDYLLGKAWDDRIGVAVAIEAMKKLKKEKHDNALYAVGTVQEEVGCRGAQTASNFVKPDIGLAIDVTIADDIPAGDQDCKLGEGPALLIYDGGTVGHGELRRQIIKIAKKNKIKYQLSYLKSGSTDASKMHLSHSGCPSISIGIPSRYIHSHTSLIHKQDYLACIDLVVEIVKAFNQEIVDQITNN